MLNYVVLIMIVIIFICIRINLYFQYKERKKNIEPKTSHKEVTQEQLGQAIRNLEFSNEKVNDDSIVKELYSYLDYEIAYWTTYKGNPIIKKRDLVVKKELSKADNVCINGNLVKKTVIDKEIVKKAQKNYKQYMTNSGRKVTVTNEIYNFLNSIDK